MNEKLNIFTDSSCPSLEVLGQYLDDALDLRKRQLLEQHMVDCPMCADALEGLNMVEDRTKIYGAVHRIRTESKRRLYEQNTRREKTSKRRSRVVPKYFMQYAASAAAAVVILWISVFIYRDLNQAQNVYEKHFQAEAIEPFTQAPAEATTPPAEELAIADQAITADSMFADRSGPAPSEERPDQSTLFVEAQETPIRDEASKNKYSAPIPATEQPEDALSAGSAAGNAPAPQGEGFTETNSTIAGGAKETASDELVLTENESEEAPEVAEDADFANDEELQQRYQQAEQLEEVVVAESKGRASNRKKQIAEKDDAVANYTQAPGVVLAMPYEDPDMKQALTQYEAGAYQEALTSLEVVLKKYPDFVEARYYAGLSHLKLQQAARAIPFLKAVSRDITSEYFEEAQWQLAGAYLLRNRKQQARKTLQAIVAKGGRYATRAQEALADL